MCLPRRVPRPSSPGLQDWIKSPFLATERAHLSSNHQMEQNLELSIALLACTPGSLNALLRDLPDGWTHRNEGADSWTVFDVLGHLVHAERTAWVPRARRILEFGESRPFDRFDRFAQFRESEGKQLSQLLDEFAQVRGKNLDQVRAMNLTPRDLEKCGRHPVLGVVKLSELLSTWVAHDLTHLHQIARIMAYQYREAVGPWTKFLGVMQCGGHSAPP